MLVLDIGDDGDLWPQTQKHMTVFIGFNHEDFTAADYRIEAGVAHGSADDGAGIDTGLLQNMRDHGSGRGLAVRAGDRDRAETIEQRRHERAPIANRNAALLGSPRFDMFRRDRGRRQYQIGAINVGCVMPREDASAFRRQCRSHLTRDQVRSADNEAALQQDARNRR